MDFEEFFRKKKIDLPALQKAEPALFSEFRTHYKQMGEKSFDHTKKYWFNKLRLQYHLAPEVKEEKVIIEKPLAEQTITDTLSETPAQPAKVGFTPRFKAGMAKTAEPAPEKTLEQLIPEAEKPAESIAPAPTLGFKPKFKTGVTKSAEPAPEAKEETEPETTEPPTPAQPPPSLGFKPKFKAGVTKTMAATGEPKEEAKPEATEPAAPTTPLPALGFKPKFKTGVTKTVSSSPEQKEEPKAGSTPEPPAEEKPSEETPAKPVYKPRFNMNNMKPKGEE